MKRECVRDSVREREGRSKREIDRQTESEREREREKRIQQSLDYTNLMTQKQP